jgi:hypothetical protein
MKKALCLSPHHSQFVGLAVYHSPCYRIHKQDILREDLFYTNYMIRVRTGKRGRKQRSS